jgi:hypothetical protein
MTILNAQAPQNSQAAPSTSVATVGIISGAVVASIFGVVLLVYILRRPSRSPMRSRVSDEDVPVVKNPVLERQRSMTFPPAPPEIDTMTRIVPTTIQNTAQRNPFAAKGPSVRFAPMPVRTNVFQLPPLPPPPPPEEEA